MWKLHDYQESAVTSAVEWAETAQSNDRYALVSPTGTGKSYIGLKLLQLLGNWFFITPSIDIIVGMLTKLGKAVPESDNAIIELALANRICTPVRFRNLLLSGHDVQVDGIILDEMHHDNAQTHTEIDALVSKPKIGLTATYYRGTPKGTAELRAKWGNPHTAISLSSADARGFISLPNTQTWPLVDDDLIEIQNGELVASQITALTQDRLIHILQRCLDSGFFANCKPTRPTIFAMPSTEIADKFMALCQSHDLATVLVTQGADRRIRDYAFRMAAEGTHALINVKVVGEGVDLPFRRYIDCSPTMSPVLWMQRLGRTVRPVKRWMQPCEVCAQPHGMSLHDCLKCNGDLYYEECETRPEYICTNRNLLRHFYLLDGALPPTHYAESVKQWGGLSTRMGARAFGLEAIGRLKPVEAKLTDGLSCVFYNVSQLVGNVKQEFAVIVHPSRPNPIWCVKQSSVVGESMQWGKWRLTDAPTELSGFKSCSTRPMSEAQAKWWSRSAKQYGLANAEPTVKEFQLLPVLSNVGLSLV